MNALVAGLAYPPFPELIDNSMRGDYGLCKKKFEWSYVHKLAPIAPSVHLHAGGAFATGLEVAKRAFYEQRLSAPEALRLGLEALLRAYGPVNFPPTRNGDKSCENVVRAFDSYFNRYGLGTDPVHPYVAENGKAMLEFTFAIPTEVMHPTTGNPILYGGRSDEIGELNGSLMVVDEKTATQLGDSWASQWDLESQFTGYVKAAMVFGYPVAGVVVRGIGLLKTKITHQDALIYRHSWEIDRWWQQLQEELQEMVDCWKAQKFRYALSKNACGAYGGCAFKMLCSTPEPEGYIPMHYRTRTWDPMAKDLGEKLLDNPALRDDSAYAPELDIPGLGG